MQIPEGQEPWWCLMCGTNLPDERLHLPTCSAKCASELDADDRRRRREAGEKLTKGWRKKVKENAG